MIPSANEMAKIAQTSPIADECLKLVLERIKCEAELGNYKVYISRMCSLRYNITSDFLVELFEKLSRVGFKCKMEYAPFQCWYHVFYKKPIPCGLHISWEPSKYRRLDIDDV